MKPHIVVLLISALFLALSTHAQNSTQGNQQNKVTKGYYGIGSNSVKLKSSAPVLQSVTSEQAIKPSVQKGFYAIGNNARQLNQQTTVISGTSRQPVVQKGYYSIGNNAEKLRQ